MISDGQHIVFDVNPSQPANEVQGTGNLHSIQYAKIHSNSRGCPNYFFS